MLDIERMKDIAHQVGSGPATRQAAMKALELVNDQLVTNVVEDVVVKERPATAVAVNSGRNVPNDQAGRLWGNLDTLLARFGSIEVVTFGGFGAELVAQKWAARNSQLATAFAVVWADRQGDGSTIQVPKPIAARDDAVQAYLAAAETRLAMLLGSPGDKSYTIAKRTHEMLVAKCDVFHSGRKLPPVGASEPVDVVEADPVEAGQPDVPPVPA